MLMCYHREHQTAKGICKSTQLYNPDYSCPLLDNVVPSLEKKKNLYEIHSPKSRKAENLDRKKQTYINSEDEYIKF